MNKVVNTLLLLLTLACVPSFGQKHSLTGTGSEVSYSRIADYHRFSDVPDAETLKDYLEDKYCATNDLSLKLFHEKHTGAGHYYSFDVTFKGHKLLDHIVKVTVDNSGRIRLVNSSISGEFDLPSHPENDYSSLVLQGFNGEDIEKVTSEPVYYREGESFIASNSIIVLLSEGGHEQHILDMNGKTLMKRDLNIYHHSVGPDTISSMKVFYPDPLTKANVTYGGAYTDMNDKNEAVLDPLREERQQQTTFLNGEFLLENDWVKIMEFSSPVNPVVTSTTGSFDFSRSHHGFEQTNCFFHISEAQNYLDSLGFNLVNYQIQVDAQALNGLDNSQFNYGFTIPRLFFGEGGIDDGEDADVIYHEFGHAISHSASGTTNFGTERQCLDEAFGDYMATTFSRRVNPFNWQKVYSWDGNTANWQGRSAVNSLNKYYPNLIFVDIYEHTDLWVDALMEIWDHLGSEETDRIVIESLHSYFQQMKYPDAAMSVIMADSLYNNGQNFFTIWNAFFWRGILPSHPASVKETNQPMVQLYGSTEFLKGGCATLLSDKELTGTVTVYNLSGKVVFDALIDRQPEFRICSSGFPQGLFILEYRDSRGSVVRYKLLKN